MQLQTTASKADSAIPPIPADFTTLTTNSAVDVTYFGKPISAFGSKENIVLMLSPHVIKRRLGLHVAFGSWLVGVRRIGDGMIDQSDYL